MVSFLFAPLFFSPAPSSVPQKANFPHFPLEKFGDKLVCFVSCWYLSSHYLFLFSWNHSCSSSSSSSSSPLAVFFIPCVVFSCYSMIVFLHFRHYFWCADPWAFFSQLFGRENQIHWCVLTSPPRYDLPCANTKHENFGENSEQIRGRIRDENSKNPGSFRSATFLT